jgi:hypothetical protein
MLPVPQNSPGEFSFSYDQETGFRLPLVSALLGLALHVWCDDPL